jgi:hypothetical protein
MTCAWADYTGFHLGPCPDSPPPYTHLWAWDEAGSQLVRARIDVDEAIVGALVTSDHPLSSVSQPLPEPVAVRHDSLLTWPPGHERIADQPSGILDRDVQAITVLSPVPITFIRADKIKRK